MNSVQDQEASAPLQTALLPLELRRDCYTGVYRLLIFRLVRCMQMRPDKCVFEGVVFGGEYRRIRLDPSLLADRICPSCCDVDDDEDIVAEGGGIVHSGSRTGRRGI